MSSSDNILQDLERYVANHPSASAMEVLANVGADPTEYRETVETLLVSDDSTEPNIDESADSEQVPHARTRNRVRRPRTRSRTDLRTRFSEWSDADFATPDSGIWPDKLLTREQWMGHVEKKPFAPWGDRDAPAECDKDGHDTAATCDCDARWKWGYRGHYVDGETVAMAEIDPRLDGRAFIQREDDPFVYVDGDDVRCPETGEVHPALIAILEHLGLTYADISQSGSGVHAIYRGDFEDLDVKQASWRLDEDTWGENEDLPSVEIYPGKRVCVMTGDHVPGTPTELNEWNDDVLEDLLKANDQIDEDDEQDDADISINREDYDLEDYEPDATSSSETTDDIRDIFAAIDRLDAQDVAEKTIVQRWNDDASTSDGERAFWPTWGSLSDGGTANIVNDKRWQDTGELGGYGGPVTMAAIDAGEIRPANARPVDVIEEAGIHRPELMHFGEEKSRNDFANEHVGLVNGCMDPGDDYVLDLLAELDLQAEVETAVDDAGQEYRARGRGFKGEDAEKAQEILASVRENHIAQAAGRYARDPTDPDVTATVFVRTDAMPPGFADVQTPGVEWVFTDLQEEIVEELRSSARSKSPLYSRRSARRNGCQSSSVPDEPLWG